jgi:glycoside/pentoside/hexuronide:cation symporter, GPH family
VNLDDGALSRKTVAAYAAAVAPMALLGMPFGVYLPPYLASGGVVALALVGLVFTLGTIWDGVADPLIGSMIDRLKLPGHHRRWIQLAAAPLLLLVAVIVAFGSSLPFPLLLITLLLFYSSLSVMDVAHLAWGSSLVNNQDESSRLFGAREWAGKWALLIGFAAPAVAQFLIPGLSLQGRIIAYASLAFLFVPLALFLAQRLPERPIAPEPGIGWKKEIAATFGFVPLVGLLLVQIFNAFAFGSITALFVFYADGTLGLDNRSSILLLLVFVGGALFTPFWVWLARRFGKPKTMIAMALWLCSMLLGNLAHVPDGVVEASIFATLLGSGFVGLVFIYGMAADLIAADAKRSGRNRTGFIFALVNLVQKGGAAFGIGVSYALLDAVGFDVKDAAAHGEKLNMLFATLPATAWLSMVIVLFWLSRRPELRRN